MKWKRVKSRAKVPARTITTTTETTVTTTQPLRHVPSLSVSLTHTPMRGIILEHCWRAQRLLVYPSFLLSNTNWYTHKHNFYYKKKVNKNKPKNCLNPCIQYVFVFVCVQELSNFDGNEPTWWCKSRGSSIEGATLFPLTAVRIW